MDRANFPDGHDIYVEDMDLIVNTVETELNKRMLHVTLTKGVAEGIAITTQNDQITIGVGQAYDDVRYRLVVTAPIVQGIAGGDNGKWVVISRTATDGTPQAHPLTGVVSNRRTIEGVAVAITATPSAAQVKICKITGVTGGAPPTISTTGVDRDILSVKVIRPFFVVATDGTGDYTTLQAALAALPSGNGKIHIKSGVYDITSTPTVSVSNVTIEGEGASTKLRIVGNVALRAILIQGAGIGTEITDINIRNLTVEYADVYASTGVDVTLPALIEAQHVRNLTVENVLFLNSNQKANYKAYGFSSLSNAQKVLVTGCRSESVTQLFRGVVESAGSYVTIARNNFTGFGGPLTSLGSGIHHSGTASTHIVIEDNTLIMAGGEPFAGIRFNIGSYATIANNSVSGGQYGIIIADGFIVGASSRIVISGNVCVGARKFGVLIGSTSGTKVLVDGNVLSDNGGASADAGVGNNITVDNIG